MNLQIVKRASKRAVAVAATVALFAAASHAAGPQSNDRIRVAAVGDGNLSSTKQPAQRDIWQLVQNTATDQDNPTPPPTDPATILAAFQASTPESTEEELAKQHGLEIVRRMTLPSLDLRVVTYRARDGSNPAEVVQRLRADQRVSSAQMNVAYRAVETDDTKVSRAEPPLNAMKGAKQPAPVGKRAATRSANANAAVQLPRSKAATERVSMHSGPVRATAADVLAGGL